MSKLDDAVARAREKLRAERDAAAQAEKREREEQWSDWRSRRKK